MAHQPEIAQISNEDLDFVYKILLSTTEPLSLKELTTKLAFEKTASELNQPLKKYDPRCRYEVGDIIYKEYDEPLLVSSKNTEMFTGAVVLRVVNKIPYESFRCEMLEVDYNGGGIFRKHIDYMKKTKTQVLLPSNMDHQGLEPEIIPTEQDPRRHEIPITEKDLKKLEKNLDKALHHDKRFFSWGQKWALTEKQINIPEEKIKEIEQYILDKQHSVTTEEIIHNIFDISFNSKEYGLACMSLNALLHKKYRKKFVYTFPEKWGKWILKEILDKMIENIPLVAPMISPSEEASTQKLTFSLEFPLKIYLGWRDILSGGVRLPLALTKELSSIEYILEDPEEEKEYSVFYFPSLHAFCGLRNTFEQFHVPQGASLTLERRTKTRFRFWIKTSKKKISYPRLTYDPETDRFQKTGEEFFSFALPNKIIHIDDETIDRLLSLYSQRDVNDLRELLILIYKEFSPEEERALHYLKAFHLVDFLRRTTQEDVEATLRTAPEFSESEKRKGVFIYQEKVKTEEEVAEEAAISERPAREGLSLSETLIAQILEEERAGQKQKEEVLLPSEQEEIEAPGAEAAEAVEITTPAEEKLQEETQPQAYPEIERPSRPGKEKEKPPKKVLKKKKHRVHIELEAAPRRRRGEKKFIEEKIELEEFEHEALIATKAKEEQEEVLPPREEEKKEKKKEEAKPFVSQPTGFGGLFAEKLKSALEEKKKNKDKK